VIHQYARVYGQSTLQAGSVSWDSCMAKNLLFIYHRIGDQKTILLSAHNGHVAKQWPAYSSMVERLKKVLHYSYQSIGLDFYEFFFRAEDPTVRASPGWENIQAEKSMFRYISYYFKNAGKLNSFLVMNKQEVNNPMARQWLFDKSLLMHSVGSVSMNTLFNDDIVHCRIGQSYDILISLQKSTPTTSFAVSIFLFITAHVSCPNETCLIHYCCGTKDVYQIIDFKAFEISFFV
jgi:erythromycin esterase-like protein